MLNKMNYIDRSQLDRLNQISSTLHRDLTNQNTYVNNQRPQQHVTSNVPFSHPNDTDLDKVPDYETLQSMYLQHLQGNIPSEYNQPYQQQYSNNVGTGGYAFKEKNQSPSKIQPQMNYHNSNLVSGEARPYSVGGT